jgi:aminoglycoside phosphotransferase (APT) family kinase protein
MGKNLCDFINDEFTSYEDKEKIVTKLARWFVDFHDYFKDNDFYIRGDSILRNFILNDKIWGVDFEESRVGKPIEDVACMCSSILTTDPMFTKEKFNLCTTFIRSYEESANWRLDNVKDEVAYAILERIQWRPDKENILRSFSNKIRKKGLLQ